MQDAKPPILLVITLAEPGGATQFVFRFAKWLKEQGEAVEILAGDGTWLFDRCQEAGISIKRISHLGREIRPWRDLGALWQLYQTFRQIKAPIIYLHSTKAGVLGSIAGKLANINKIVYRIGGWVFLESLPGWKKSVYLFLERWTAHYKHTIVCVHPNDEQVAKEKKIFPKESLLTIPNGLDFSLFETQLLPKQAARKQLQLSQTAFLFGTIAHFYPSKNLVAYLQVCAHIKKRHPMVEFVLIGDGPERANIERTINRLHLEESVHLLGNREQAGRFLAAFDAFVLPSNKEGMPTALLEAIAARIPCIASDVGANRWMLGKNGWLFSPQKLEQLQDAMNEVIHNPIEATQRATMASEEAKQRFAIEPLYQRHRQLLR